MRLITRVTSLDTSSVLLKRFPWSSFFNFGNKSKAGGLMSGLYGGWGSTCHPHFSKISDTAPEPWGRALMYDRWPMREIWLQSVSSSISRLHFAELGPRIRTYWSLLKSGSQLLQKAAGLHHPTGRASTVCRTFEMTYVHFIRIMFLYFLKWEGKNMNYSYRQVAVAGNIKMKQHRIRTTLTDKLLTPVHSQ